MTAFRTRQFRRFLDDLDAGSPATTVLGERSRLTGRIVTEGDVVIAGVLDGGLETEGRVLVAPGGSVLGPLRAGDAKIEGSLDGPLEARGRVEVGREAKLRGGIRASRLDVAEGAEILGEVATQSPAQRFVERRT